VHKRRLTDITIRALLPPEKGNVVLWDDLITGFGVRCSQGGTKSYFLLHGRQRERLQIGRVGVISLQEARAQAKRFQAEQALGRRENPTLKFEEAVAIFLQTQADRLRPKTMLDYRRILNSHFNKPLKGKPLTEIQTHHLTAIIDKLQPTKAECNYSFAVARRFFRWAVTRRYIPHSPLEGIGMPTKAQTRDRVLTPAELRKSGRKPTKATLVQ